ncbi:hypothetical protein TI03_04205 [Achromatium sp. WMS1]|nr:hypothetical protein TI03_04205 [Achromatium sp. WMS1]
MEICHFCGNKNFKFIKTQYTYQKNAKFLIIDDVPCKQCEYCGEQYFEANVLKKIENEFEVIHYHRKKTTKQIIVPIEPYSEIISV